MLNKSDADIQNYAFYETVFNNYFYLKKYASSDELAALQSWTESKMLNKKQHA